MDISARLARSFPLALAVVAFAPHLAFADPNGVSCAEGKFGDHIENGHVVGDAGSIFAAKKAVYWVDVANPGAPTAVTLVWTVDGREVQRQSLDVGQSPHWHTWGMRPLGGGTKVDVVVLDASGATLKQDSIGSVP